MPSIDDIFSSQFLRASDLKGQSRTATIEAVAPEVFGSGATAQQKLIVRLTRIRPRLVLNKVNATTIAEALGRDYTQWVGRTIELRPEKTMYQGQLVDCIRCHVQAAAAPVPPGGGISEMSSDVPW
jgi:hypothetical protein